MHFCVSYLKAVHIEIVSDLTSEAFVATLRRFIARRGTEACLNSRPLTPLNLAEDNLEALIPGHFLIGCPLESVPDPASSHQSSSLGSCTNQSIVHHFWNH